MSSEVFLKARKGTSRQAYTVAFSLIVVFTILYLLSLAIGPVKFLTAIAIRPNHWQYLYTLILYEFGHVSWMHLAMNLTELGMLSYFVTRLLGWKNCLYAILLSCLGSGLFVWLFAPSTAMVVGASGINAGLAIYLLGKSLFPVFDPPMVSMGAVFVTITLIGIVSTLGNPGGHVSWEAHVGGLITGLLYLAVQFSIKIFSWWKAA